MITVVISVSGGRTSAYMAEWMISNKNIVGLYFGVPASEISYVFLFANTGREENDTLRFLNEVNKNVLNNELVWLEAVINPVSGKGTRHRIVSYETAMRKDQFKEPNHPFSEYARKYGVPNVKFKSCTRELKLRPIDSYLRDLGLKKRDYWTAIGIRTDETRRVSVTADEQNIFYPLVHINPIDKEDVLTHWEDREYDLRIPEHRGNCITCFKKSFKKLNKVYLESPEDFEFCDWIEKEFGMIGAEFEKYGRTEPRKHFREERNTGELIALFKMTDTDPTPYISRTDAGCSESCEMFPTE